MDPDLHYTELVKTFLSIKRPGSWKKKIGIDMKHLKTNDPKQIFIKAHGSKFWKAIHSDRAIGGYVRNI